MRQLLFVLTSVAAWFLASALAYAQAPVLGSRVKVTQLIVRENWHDTGNHFVVRADLLEVNRTSISGEYGRREMRYERALTPSEHRWLLAPLDPVYLSRLQPMYEGTWGPTDGFFCDVIIHKGTYWKETRFVRYSFAPLRTFSDRLNALLPLEFHFSYFKQHRYGQ